MAKNKRIEHTHMSERYFPEIGDRFKVFVLTRIEHATHYEKHVLKTSERYKYFGWPCVNGENCKCTEKHYDYLSAIDEDGNGRVFRYEDFYFLKAG